LDGFIPLITDVQSEDKFKRAKFSLFDAQERKIGQLDLSLSLVRKGQSNTLGGSYNAANDKALITADGFGSTSKLLNSQKILDNDSISMSASLNKKLVQDKNNNNNNSSIRWGESSNFNGGKSMTMQDISDHFSKKNKNNGEKDNKNQQAQNNDFVTPRTNTRDNK
jgi:hypothetical protein